MKEKKSAGKILGNIIGRLGNSLTLLFCILRACDIIKWEWYWVMMPFFAAIGVFIIALLIVGILMITVLNSEKEKNLVGNE